MGWREEKLKREVSERIGVEYNPYVHTAFFVVLHDRAFKEWRVGATADSITEAKRDLAYYKRSAPNYVKVFIVSRAAMVKKFSRVIGGSGRLVKRKGS